MWNYGYRGPTVSYTVFVQRTGTSDPHTVQGSAVYNNLENANYSDKAEDDGGSREG